MPGTDVPFAFLNGSPQFEKGEFSGRIYVHYCERRKAMAFEVLVDGPSAVPATEEQNLLEGQLAQWVYAVVEEAQAAGWKILARSELLRPIDLDPVSESFSSTSGANRY
jgi:hypothetical protein